MDKELNPLFRNIRMENTRLLVKGVEYLHQGYQQKFQKEITSGGNNLWQLDGLQKFVADVYGESVQNGEYLAQNPYVEIFRFRKSKPDELWMIEQDSFRLSGMVLLYHQLQILEEISPDQLAEAYEILCNSIRRILKADMCYLVSRHMTDTRMLSASSVMEKDLDTQLGSKEAGDLLDQLSVNRKFFQLAEGAFLKEESEPATNESGMKKARWEEADTLILPIMLYDKNGKRLEEQIYLICQRRGCLLWKQNLADTLLCVRDTLFLRGQLAHALTRDLTALTTVVRGYRDVRRRTSEKGPLRILHISDLHVTTENCELLKNAIQKLDHNKDSFDFLVITGDVVQGRQSAGYLERHYDCAAQVIRRMAFHMWSEKDAGERILRQDWKRRTIIIPGNHDYASMNELETQHGENHRASESGRPAIQEGSVMAKFTYYVNFIRKLLDVEIGELIDDDLNELRRYDKMGVDFLCFNTSIMANPARNNKVHLDQRFAQRVIQRLSSENKKQAVIFLGHHGPDYAIDYVSDEYLEPFICRKITNYFTAAMQTGHAEDRKNALKALEKVMETLELESSADEIDDDFVQAWLLKNKMNICPEDVMQKVVTRRKNTRLYKQLTFLLEQLEKAETERDINERYQKIIAEVNRAKLLSDNDRKAYEKVFRMLNSELQLTACLSGHTHERSEYDNHHYVATRFYSERMVREFPNSDKLKQISYLHYGVCEIVPTRTDNQLEVKYSPEDKAIS